MKYRKEIDGLRALAVLPVILFHAGFEIVSGGFVGVDVFFVISGFLITSILLQEHENNRFSLLDFYERRARRILPALYFILGLSIIMAWQWLLPVDMERFSEKVIAVVFFVSNFFFWKESGYFDAALELKPLLHTWSLAVEEQFYVFFPLLLIVLWKMPKRSRVPIIALIALSSLMLAHWAAYNKPVAAFYLLPARCWELLLGALAAFYNRLPTDTKNRLSAAHQQWVSLLGLALIVISLFLFDKQTPFPSLYTLLPTIGAVLILLFTQKGSIVYTILGNRLFVGIGLISYSAYLWHFPLFAFARHANISEPSLANMFALSGLTLVLAYFTWRFIENPFRNKQAIRTKTVLICVAVFSCVFVSIGALGLYTKGFQFRITYPPNVEWYSLGERVEREGDVCIPTPQAHYEGITACDFGDVTAQRTVAIYGDSHAQAIEKTLDQRLKSRGIKGIKLAIQGCSVVPTAAVTNQASRQKYNTCTRRFETLKRYLQDNAESTIVISRWTFRLFPIQGAIDSLTFDNGVGGIERATYREHVIMQPDGSSRIDGQAKEKAVKDFINALSAVTRLILVYPVPEAGWNIFKTNWRYYSDNKAPLAEMKYPKQTYLDRHKFIMDIFDQLAQTNQNIVPVKPHILFCDRIIKNYCVAQHNAVPLYYDDDHLSDQGGALLVEEISTHLPAE